MAAKNLVEITKFVVSLSNAIVESLADGKINLFDIPKFTEALRLASPAFTDIEDVIAELGALNAEDQAVIKAEVSKLDLPNDKVEDIIKLVINGAVALGAIIAELLKPKAPIIVTPIG